VNLHHVRFLAMATMLCGTISPASRAQHVGDIYVGLNGNQLITGRINPDRTIDTTARVYRSIFGDSGFPGFTSNPGYDAGFIFNPAYRIGFNILSPLEYWNGDGFEATGAGGSAGGGGAGGGETLDISFLSLTRTTHVCVVPGFDLAVQANGGWHRHLSMFLNPPSGGLASPGVYLLKLELYSTAPGFLDSPPYWIVFNHQVDAATHEAAFAWVQQNLADPTCPADSNHDGSVNVNDLLLIINAWGDPSCSPADLNGDNAVNVNDLLHVINSWGPCPAS